MSTPAPTILGVLSPAFIFPHGVCGSQLPSLVPNDAMCSLSIPDNLSYPRFGDTYEASSINSLSPIQMDPPIFPTSPLPANPSPIVGQVLGFDSMDAAAPLQPCSHPRLKDTCLVDPRLGSKDCMVDEPESQSLDTFEDPTGLEVSLCNSSLDVRTVERVVERMTMLVS